MDEGDNIYEGDNCDIDDSDEDCSNEHDEVEDCSNNENSNDDEPHYNYADGIEDNEREVTYDKSVDHSTYESITDIQLDKPPEQLNCKISNLNPDDHSSSSSDKNDRDDGSSVSYKSAPEEPLPSCQEIKPRHIEEEEPDVEEGSEHDGEDGSDDDKENNPIGGSRSKPRTAAVGRKKKSHRSSLYKRKSKSHNGKGKDKKHSQTASRPHTSRPTTSRDMIRPESQNTDVPKRPMTAFKLFMSDFRKQYSVKYPNVSFAEMTEISAEVWRDMPSDKKAAFQEEANRLQEDYLNQMREYQAKKQQEKFSKPKTAYQIFMSDYLNKEYVKRKNLKTQSRLTKQDLFMRGVRKWNRMTRSQKKTYEEQALRSKQIQNSLHNGASTSNKLCNSHTDEQLFAPLPEPTPSKKNRKIEFSEEDEVAQFRADGLETWFQASKGF